MSIYLYVDNSIYSITVGLSELSDTSHLSELSDCRTSRLTASDSVTERPHCRTCCWHCHIPVLSDCCRTCRTVDLSDCRTTVGLQPNCVLSEFTVCRRRTVGPVGPGLRIISESDLQRPPGGQQAVDRSTRTGTDECSFCNLGANYKSTVDTIRNRKM